MAWEPRKENLKLGKDNKLLRSGVNTRITFRAHGNHIQTTLQKLNELYTSVPTALYFIIFRTTTCREKINLLEILLKLSDVTSRQQNFYIL